MPQTLLVDRIAIYFFLRKLLKPATKLLKPGDEIAENWRRNYWNLAMKLLKPGDELLRPAKAKARRGEQPGDYERQLGASGGGRCVRRAPGPGEIKGTCAPKGSTR